MNREIKIENTKNTILTSITNEIVKILDIDSLLKLTPPGRLERLSFAIKKIIKEKRMVISDHNIAGLVREIYEEIFEYGPISALVRDDSVSEIMINNWDDIYIEKADQLIKTDYSFRGSDQLINMIERIISPLGLRIDESSPMVDARLRDGSRINAVLNPVTFSEIAVTIRKFKKNLLSIDDLISAGTLSKKIAEFISDCVKNKLNIIVSGGSSTGKTTLLNIISNFIPCKERIVSIEDTLELDLALKNIVRLESRPANIEGEGAVTLRDLVRNALRMRPDRIIVGEIRGIEAIDVLQAMNTGHEGSMTTVHANNPMDLISRLEAMLLMSGINLTPSSARQIILSSIDIVIHLERKTSGKRFISKISKFIKSGMEIGESTTLTVKDIF